MKRGLAQRTQHVAVCVQTDTTGTGQDTKQTDVQIITLPRPLALDNMHLHKVWGECHQL